MSDIGIKMILRQVQNLFLFFWGHATFDNIREAFKGALSPLNIKSILQISMDSPNANHNFFKDLKAEFESEHGSEILNICTCILPIMHGAIKAVMQSTNWLVVEFLRALFNLFKDVLCTRQFILNCPDRNAF